MASATPLKDIDEQFLQCCICMEQLKEPKILPCLHRYCQECLKKFAKKGAKKIRCVTCRKQHTLPKDGIKGLKTDFNTKNIIEFIQLQDSVKVDPLRNCIHCKKKLKASAFCFKCNDFLCKTCHEFHASSSMFKDHHPHIFSLSEAEASNLTIQKLTSLKEAPRCQAHPSKLTELCCTTCGNLPICIPCTFGEHKGHDLIDVSSLAKIQRDMLRSKVADLMQNKEKAYQIQAGIRKTKGKLDHNVKEEELIRQEQLHGEGERFEKGIRNAEAELRRKQTNLEEEFKAKTSPRKKDLEKKIKQLREEYEQVRKEERREVDAKLKKLGEENKRETERLQEGLRAVNDGIKELLASLKIQKDEQARKIKELSDHFDEIVKRFETVTTTVDCIRAAENDWADIRCIPDVCRSIDLLSEDVKKSSTGLNAVKFRGLSHSVTAGCKAGISKDVESVIDMQSVMRISGITSFTDGSIAVTGYANEEIHLTVINVKGDLLQQKVISAIQPYDHKCSFLTKFKIAIIFGGDKLGIYDMRDQSLKFAMLKDAITNWPYDQEVLSVTTDPANDNIIIGCDSRHVYVFNDQLEHIRTITLPAGFQGANSIAMHEGGLLVCDLFSVRVSAVTVHEPFSQVKYELTEPTIVVGSYNHWSPVEVCTDQNGYVYMFWGAIGRNESVIQKYSRDGGQIEMMSEVGDKRAIQSITSVQTNQGEKLLLAKPGHIIMYGFV